MQLVFLRRAPRFQRINVWRMPPIHFHIPPRDCHRMMSPLCSKLDEVRQRVRHLVMWRGSAYLLTIVILVILAACCADAWLHFDAVAVRISLLTFLVLCTLVGGGVLLAHPWRKTIHDAELARQMERSGPGSLRSLASGVEFDGANCSADHGSRSLQQAVVKQQGRRLAAQDVTELIDTRPVQRAVMCALAACLLAGGALLADRPRASQALHRLFVPLDAPAWPREHTLRLLDEDFQPLAPADPVIVAAGRTPTFFVEDINGRLPDEVVLRFWQEGVEQPPQILETDGKERLAFSIRGQGGYGRLRAVGGDDERMPWHYFQRIAPPAIEHLNLRIRPPEYTNQPTLVVTSPTGTLQALLGTVIEVQLMPDKSLESAMLMRDGQPDSPLQERGSLDEGYALAWEIRDPGELEFWFELTDQFGLQNVPVSVHRYELNCVEDEEPVVSIEYPPTHMTLTPVASVPFRCVAEDDVGLSQVRLVYSDPPGSEGTQLYPLPSIEEGARHADLETTLSMADLGARPGANIIFRAEATDAYDRGPEHVGRSDRHTVLIVTPEEKLHELLNREIGIAETIERAIAMQTESARQTRQLRLQWRHTATLRPQDKDLLNRAIHDSSRTEMELYDDRRGAESRVVAIREELVWNRIDDEATRDRLHVISAELERLRIEAVPLLRRSLATARKASTAHADDENVQVADALASAESMQVEIAETLQVLLGMLRGWRERYDLMRSLAEISDEQEQLNAETTAFGQPLLERETLDDQDEADFARFAERQENLAEQLADLAESAVQSAAEESRDTQTDHDNLLQLADALERSGAREAMARAAELLQNYNVGEAMTIQAELIESLRSLTEALDEWEPADTETLLKQLERAQEEVEALHRRQTDAFERAAAMTSAGATSETELQQLRREQQELAEETAESALRLRKQNIVGAAASSSAAAEAMRAAAGGLQDDITETALRQQQQALDDLQEARDELSHLRQTLELRFAMQQASQLSATLEAYRDRQLELRDQAADLSDAQDQAGRLRRSQLSALNNLKRTQSELADDVASLTTDMETMPAFRIVLNAAVDAMHSAEERLTPDQLADAVQYQTTAAERLTEIFEALNSGGAGPAPVPGPGGQGGDAQQGQLDWTLIAQIRLLRGMQSQIARRIAELTQATSTDAALTDEQQLELDELTALQGQSAEVAADLLEAAMGAAESVDSELEEAVP